MNKHRKITKICGWCGGEFEARVSNVERNKGLYCGDVCKGKASAGKRWGGGLAPATV